MKRVDAQRWLLLAPILAVLGILAGILTLLQHSADVAGPLADAELDRADYFLVDADIRSYDPDGVLVQRLQADRVAYFPDSSAQLEQVMLTRLPGPWQLRADHGLSPSGLQMLHLRGAVELETTLDDGQRAELQTEALDIDWTERTLTSVAPVRMQSTDVTATANRLYARLESRDIALEGEVRVAHQP